MISPLLPAEWEGEGDLAEGKNCKCHLAQLKEEKSTPAPGIDGEKGVFVALISAMQQENVQRKLLRWHADEWHQNGPPSQGIGDAEWGDEK